MEQAQITHTLDKKLNDWVFELHSHAQQIKQTEFKHWCFEHIKQILNFDSGLWISRSDMDDKVNVHWREDASLYNQPGTFIDNYARIDAKPENIDVLNQTLSNSPGKFLSVWECCDKSQFIHTEYYTEHCVPYNIANAISALMLPGEYSSIVHIFSFYRADDDNDFVQSEKLLADYITPHILEAYQSNLLASFKSNNSTTFHGIIDRFGQIVVSQTGFTEYMKEQGLYEDTRINIEEVRNLTSPSQLNIGQSKLHLDYKDGLIYVDAKDLSKQLTERQIEISCLVAKGMSNQEAASLLGLKASTVNNHLQKIFIKLGINNKTKLTSYLIREGLLNNN